MQWAGVRGTGQQENTELLKEIRDELKRSD